MIILFSLFFTIIRSFSCEFSGEVKNVYSLSGPVSLALRDLGLTKSPKLKAVSTFHPIDKSFHGEFFPGGLFLSIDWLHKMKGGLVFYDEARELTKSIARIQGVHGVEVRTRQLSPMGVSHYLEKVLSPYVRNCNFAQMHQELDRKLETLARLIPLSRSYLFFLGEIRGARLPEMLMVQDGVVQWMIEKVHLQTYPSKLSYVTWSSKVMRSMPQNTLKVGLIDSGSKMIYEKIQNKEGINLTFPGGLIPGTGQVEAMLFLFKK